LCNVTQTEQCTFVSKCDNMRFDRRQLSITLYSAYMPLKNHYHAIVRNTNGIIKIVARFVEFHKSFTRNRNIW